jgi:uncharacterized protein
MSTAKFEVKKSPKDDQFYFHLKAGNGEITLSSEGYVAKQGCLNGIAAVKKNAPHDEQYERKDQPANYRFNLKAGNGEIIGTSQGYTTAAAREAGIASVKKDAPDAPIVDLT